MQRSTTKWYVDDCYFGHVAHTAITDKHMCRNDQRHDHVGMFLVRSRSVCADVLMYHGETVLMILRIRFVSYQYYTSSSFIYFACIWVRILFSFVYFVNFVFLLSQLLLFFFFLSSHNYTHIRGISHTHTRARVLQTKRYKTIDVQAIVRAERVAGMSTNEIEVKRNGNKKI